MAMGYNVENGLSMEENQKRSEEFKEAVKHVVDYLNKYHTPMDYALIREGFAEILSGDTGVVLLVRD